MCLPVFGGFGGTAPYAPAKPAVKVTLTSSTSDYNGKLPKLGKGTALLYGQYAFAAKTTFGKEAVNDVEITGAQILAGKTYTLFGQFVVNGKKTNKSPCYSVATKGKYGGVFDAGPGLSDTSVSAHTVVIGELYSGLQASKQCA